MSDFAFKLLSLPAIVIGLTVHEYCHARMAFALGDPTARNDGRLTLNPLKHIDPVGFLFLLIAGFGWARPVSFDQRYLLKPKRDEALIALAGPISNLLLAILWTLVFKFQLIFIGFPDAGLASTLGYISYCIITMNLGLFIFNLIPLPPLDGFHVFLSRFDVPRTTEAKLYKYGSIALFIIILAESLLKVDILPIGKLIRIICNLLFSLFAIPIQLS